MAVALAQPTMFDDYVDALYDENKRGYAELLSLQYAIVARVGLNEADALELACRIVALAERQKRRRQRRAGDRRHLTANVAETPQP